jgi:hypothetical protein
MGGAAHFVCPMQGLLHPRSVGRMLVTSSKSRESPPLGAPAGGVPPPHFSEHRSTAVLRVIYIYIYIYIYLSNPPPPSLDIYMYI